MRRFIRRVVVPFVGLIYTLSMTYKGVNRGRIFLYDGGKKPVHMG